MAVPCVKNHYGRTYFDEFLPTCLRGAVFLRHSVIITPTYTAVSFANRYTHCSNRYSGVFVENHLSHDDVHLLMNNKVCTVIKSGRLKIHYHNTSTRLLGQYRQVTTREDL